MADISALKDKYTKAGQGHVFQFYDGLADEQKKHLVEQLQRTDPEFCNQIFKTATAPLANQDTSLAPLPEASFDSTMTASPEKLKAWHAAGMKAIADSHAAVLLLAGGQGTRLGSSAPKGCYDIGLPSHKSLFQIQAERILRLQTLAGENAVIPWYIMKMGKATPDYFKEKNYFGINPQNIFFFEQGTLPAFTMEGKILLEGKGSVTEAPDGNGGIYASMKQGGVLADMKKRGIKYIHAYGVDNCLVRVADPTFFGYCITKNADCGAKTVRKSVPTEAVGVICLRGGKFNVVEYSEIDAKLAEQRKADGSLAYGAANIANHFYTLDFLNSVDAFTHRMAYHVAKKKIKHVDVATGNEVNPDKPNGIKLELFIFDVFPFTERMAVLEADRREEFSPLKNAPGAGVDCPETSRADIMAQHVRFAKAAGALIVKGEEDKEAGEAVVFELGPLVTYEGEGLETMKGVTVKTPKLVNTPAELHALTGKEVAVAAAVRNSVVSAAPAVAAQSNKTAGNASSSVASGRTSQVVPNANRTSSTTSKK